jgi:succinate dehydrogenase / fumarate reductase, cytochrome b subunit
MMIGSVYGDEMKHILEISLALGYHDLSERTTRCRFIALGNAWLTSLGAPPMIGVLTLYDTTIGKKVVMALTGFVLYGFVMVHMIGNLKVFSGPEKINAYGVFLREVGGPIFSEEFLLWLARVVLLVSVVLHMVAAYQLTRLDLASRPINYAVRKNNASGYAARTLRWGGVIIALFIVYHILHFTTGTVHPSFRGGDVYHNLVAGFANPLVSLFYVVAMLALGVHLYHGAWSMFQTLGLNNTNNKRFFQWLATLSAVALVVGNTSIPLAVLFGLIR